MYHNVDIFFSRIFFRLTEKMYAPIRKKKEKGKGIYTGFYVYESTINIIKFWSIDTVQEFLLLTSNEMSALTILRKLGKFTEEIKITLTVLSFLYSY